ncbi:MAG: hypothetical protein RSG96_03960 [Clostridia bacterium]
MRKRSLAVLCLVALLMLGSGALATEDLEDVSMADTPQKPYLYVVSPQSGASYESGSKLTVQISGSGVAYYELELIGAEERLTYAAQGAQIEHEFVFSKPQTQGATLKVRGYAAVEPTAQTPVTELVQLVPSPKQELIERMIALAYANSKDSRYKFAPAEEDYDIGVCKNFVMRLFDTYAKEYRMAAYPALALHMPKNNSKAACAPYDYGIEWRPEAAQDGSPFKIAAQFKYDAALTKEENAKLARALIQQIRKGDFFQIVGYYGGGNGPHSMYIIEGYDPVTRMLHWTDSNMRGTRVNGVRWGYMQYDADADEDWWVEVFNRPKRGATLYRLRDDLYKE